MSSIDPVFSLEQLRQLSEEWSRNNSHYAVLKSRINLLVKQNNLLADMTYKVTDSLIDKYQAQIKNVHKAVDKLDDFKKKVMKIPMSSLEVIDRIRVINIESEVQIFLSDFSKFLNQMDSFIPYLMTSREEKAAPSAPKNIRLHLPNIPKKTPAPIILHNYIDTTIAIRTKANTQVNIHL